MAAKKLTQHKTAEEQPSIIGPIDRNRKRKFGSYSYKPKYADIIFKLLSESDTAKTKSHCCNALQCSRPTLDKWLNQFPEFREAFEAGLEIGKMKWRDRLAEYAFHPSAAVNNGLIKMLSANVYGIHDDPQQIALTAPEPIKFIVEVVSVERD